MNLKVKANVEFEIDLEQTWLEIINDFYTILVDSDGDITFGNDESLCTQKVDGWKMLKMIKFVDYLEELEFQVGYLKDYIKDYSNLELFMDDLSAIFNDSLKIARDKFRIKQEELEQ